MSKQIDPLNPDTDGEGYWDGWIGVHGVGYSDNVILYREVLWDDDGNGVPSGVQGDENVPEQIGYHSANANESTAATTSAEIDGQQVHSNVHVGELQWGTNPNNRTEKPDPTVRIEVDYYPNLRGRSLFYQDILIWNPDLE